MSERRDDLPLPMVVGIVIAFAVLLWAGAVALTGWFHGELGAETERKLVEPPVAELEALRAAQRDELASYRIVDRDAGVVRLPIERAMELVAAEDAAVRGGTTRGDASRGDAVGGDGEARAGERGERR